MHVTRQHVSARDGPAPTTISIRFGTRSPALASARAFRFPTQPSADLPHPSHSPETCNSPPRGGIHRCSSTTLPGPCPIPASAWQRPRPEFSGSSASPSGPGASRRSPDQSVKRFYPALPCPESAVRRPGPCPSPRSGVRRRGDSAAPTPSGRRIRLGRVSSFPPCFDFSLGFSDYPRQIRQDSPTTRPENPALVPEDCHPASSRYNSDAVRNQGQGEPRWLARNRWRPFPK
jgi:hypothetical protein